MEGSLLAYAEEVLGACSTVEQEQRAGGSDLLQVLDADGERWYVKRVERTGIWRSEIRAYRRWVPALGDRAPRLRAADPERQTMVLSFVAGERPAADDPGAHRQAGSLLQRFHHARPSRPAPDEFAQSWSNRLEGWLAEADGAFSRSERRFARKQTRRLRRLQPQHLVPCHGDYRPHNWLMDDDRVLRVIDFGDARMGVWAWDLTRLSLGPWWECPELATVFMSGYGVDLTDDDRALIDFNGAAQAVIQVAWAHKHSKLEVEENGRQRLQELMAGRSVLPAAG